MTATEAALFDTLVRTEAAWHEAQRAAEVMQQAAWAAKRRYEDAVEAMHVSGVWP